jgi:RNA polymerase sigma-70 factor (ECF subfamily)
MDELDDTVIEDERLELIFTCCHPAIALECRLRSRRGQSLG